MSENINNCDPMFSFFLNELTPEQSKAFVEHLSTCPMCATELKGLQQVWQTLPHEMEEIDLPDSLKSQMLDNIMKGIYETSQIEVIHTPPIVVANSASHLPDSVNIQFDPSSPVNSLGAQAIPPLAQLIKPAKRWSFVAAAVLYIAIGAAIGWGINDYSNSQLASPPAALELTAQPAQVVSQYTLKAFDPAMPGASGKCFVKQQGDSKQLVLQVNGLNMNSGDWAYQVWLIKEGVRYNGGTFRVNEKGDGILTYDLSPAISSFEALGITLEPDAAGSKPRGKKVLGT
ncbi:anti-sigma factor [Paenibacillus agricola]|uniref:Regulator of SigK n=1 Tax=Paenibacillus agricola TaxID=2716264 RepID=A0ABX0IYQ2_9BACL|nr:anti-sigma factor [Paenibacillus agricola]NHN28563.1 hypothetical protein [Paenibacillus agricola]